MSQGANKLAFLSAFGVLETWIEAQVSMSPRDIDALSFKQKIDSLTKEGVLVGSSPLMMKHLHDCRNLVAHRFSFEPSTDQARQWIRWIKQITLKDGNIRSLITTPVTTIAETETIENAIALMKDHDYSQIPVMRANQPIGYIDEWSVLNALARGEGILDPNDPVSSIVELGKITRIPIDTDLNEAMRLLRKQRRPGFLLVFDADNLEGILTKSDVLNLI